MHLLEKVLSKVFHLKSVTVDMLLKKQRKVTYNIDLGMAR